MKHFAHETFAFLATLLAGLVPGAIGAVVGLVWERGMTWGQRFAQLAVGIIVSFFVGRAVSSFWAVAPFVEDGIKFVLGMIAYKATPGFIAATSDTLRTLPARLRDHFLPRGHE